jgi:hypothetical protein
MFIYFEFDSLGLMIHKSTQIDERNKNKSCTENNKINITNKGDKNTFKNPSP